MKYKLKEDFAGKKAGEIIDGNGQGSALMWTYQKALIQIDRDSDLLEEVKDEPLFYTNEDEVYLDGKRIPIYYGNMLYFVDSRAINRGLDTIIKKNGPLQGVKYFATKQAAEDYIKLQQDIKDSGLKIGDAFKSKLVPYFSTAGNYYSESSYSGLYKIVGFTIFRGDPCVILDSWSSNTFIKLSDLIKPKLLFGNKEVTLTLCNNQVQIHCQGEISCYSEAKKFRDAITTIQNFKFGKHLLDAINDKQIDIIGGDSYRFGCTTGTIQQIDAILKECERMLKL